MYVFIIDLIPYSGIFFGGPNFLKNPVSPPEEIFAFSASTSFGPRPFIITGLTEAERSPVGDGRMSSAGLKQ